MAKDRPILTLSVAAALLKVHPRTLMLYEKEGLIQPHRTGTNRRLFSEADLDLIQFIKYLISQERVNITGAGVIIRILRRAHLKYPTLKKEFFPEYKEKKLI